MPPAIKTQDQLDPYVSPQTPHVFFRSYREVSATNQTLGFPACTISAKSPEDLKF